MTIPTILAAAGAAILRNDQVPAEFGGAEDDRFVVHPHVAEVKPDEAALLNYLDDIYSAKTKVPIDVGAPNNADFKRLADKATVVEATRNLAESLRVAMEPTSARPGLLFGFSLLLPSGKPAHGIVKADLEDAERFFFDTADQNEWTIGSVRDILPPPQTKYAKYVIAPRPKAPGAAGIRDTQAAADSAAGYLLGAVGLTVSQRKGTKQKVAEAAQRSGYGEDEIREQLGKVKSDRPTVEVVEEYFPEIPDEMRQRLLGSATHPMPTVVADDPFLTTRFTTDPTFTLTTDESVEVTVAGRVITVQLPEGHSPIERKFGK